MIGDGSCQKCPSGCISCSSDKNCTCCSHGRYVAFPSYLKKIILKNERDRLGHILLTRPFLKYLKIICIFLYHITLITYSFSATSRTVTVLKDVELVTSPSMSTIVMN